MKKYLFILVLGFILTLISGNSLFAATGSAGYNKYSTGQTRTPLQTHVMTLTAGSQQNQPSLQAEDHSSMNMPGMDMTGSDTQSNDQHQADSEMDPIMSGMVHSAIHENNSSSDTINWNIIYSFLIVNVLIITVAGLLKNRVNNQLNSLQ